MGEPDQSKPKSEFSQLPEWPKDAKDLSENRSQTITRNKLSWALGMGFLGSVFLYAIVIGAAPPLRGLAIFGGFLMGVVVGLVIEYASYDQERRRRRE